jgi:hypothetical protein
MESHGISERQYIWGGREEREPFCSKVPRLRSLALLMKLKWSEAVAGDRDSGISLF